MKTLRSLLFSKQKGFTLIELLLVVLIIATLTIVVFAALSPTARLQATRNARRTSDADTILTAVHEYIIDHAGSAPAGLSTADQQLGTATTGCTNTNGTCNTGTGCLDLSSTANLGRYLKSIPQDPLNGTAGITGYSVSQDSNGLISVKACNAEGSTITVSR